jgi:hypothetical protein
MKEKQSLMNLKPAVFSEEPAVEVALAAKKRPQPLKNSHFMRALDLAEKSVSGSKEISLEIGK